jgi:predicted ATPase
VISELGIGNFKGFGEIQRIPIKPLTLIFGANSSGKSSLIQALLLAHHALETGEFDVHQAKLAGDLVDLGGFRNYLHKHDTSKEVTLYFETNVDCQAVLNRLQGNEKERVPFLKPPHSGQLKQFGVSMTVAGTPPVLKWIEILLNRAPILRLCRCAWGTFRAEPATGNPPYLSDLTAWILELSALSHDPQGLRREFMAAIAAGDEQRKEAILREIEAAEEAIRREFADGKVPREKDLIRFNETFRQVLAEDEFSVERFVVRDPGQEALLRNWPSGRGQLAEGLEGGLLAFFQENADWASNDPTTPWWAEAQALRHNLSILIESCSSRIADVLSRFSYLGPLRCMPARYAVQLGATDGRAMSTGAAAWDELGRNPTVLRTMNRWLGDDYLRLPYMLKSVSFLDADRIRTALRGQEQNADSLVQNLAETPDSSVLVFEDRLARTTVSHRDIGFGVSQVLPVLVNAGTMEQRLIAIEQPELHLHPAQQADLGDVFVESALGERRNTFLLETHSEHLLLRIMRRMRETFQNGPKRGPAVTPADVAVLYVERDGDHSIVREMALNERGELVKAWPGGFFEEGLREVLP